MDKNRQMIEQIFQDYMAREKKITLERYCRLNQVAIKGETLLVGSSLMEQFPVYELMMSLGIPGIVYNRGIGGFTTAELLDVLDTCVFDLQPSRIFMNIGSNDMAMLGFSIAGLRDNYRRIISEIRTRLPECQITLMAYYPINDTVSMPGIDAKEFFATRNNETIKACNAMVEQLAAETGCSFIDITGSLTDDSGRLRLELTVEGLHMWPDAYIGILKDLKPYLV